MKNCRKLGAKSELTCDFAEMCPTGRWGRREKQL